MAAAQVLAAIQPGTLVEMWRALQACHRANVIVICQAANTGLTGGSTHAADGYDRPVVVINGMRSRRLDVIRNGEQLICQPGDAGSTGEASLAAQARTAFGDRLQLHWRFDDGRHLQ